MPDILHKVGIRTSSPAAVYQAITTIDGLSHWWTGATSGKSEIGGIIKFRFGKNGFDMRVLDLQPDRRVVWQVVGGPEDWLDTTLSFDLTPSGDWTLLFFKHQNWRAASEFMHHCSTKWAVFLLSLKSLVETGKGAPWPDEIKIDSWE